MGNATLESYENVDLMDIYGEKNLFLCEKTCIPIYVPIWGCLYVCFMCIHKRLHKKEICTGLAAQGKKRMKDVGGMTWKRLGRGS